MKRVLVVLMAAVTLTAFAATVANDRTDGRDKSLESLWAKYETARNNDLPQSQIGILSQIKQLAIRDHLPVDFYDASSRYVTATVQRNWKMRDSVYSQFRIEVTAFNEPIVSFAWMTDFGRVSKANRLAYVRTEKDRLSSASHPWFYTAPGQHMHGAIKEFISSDYEYALWSLMPDSRDDLKAVLQDSYPGGAYMEYLDAESIVDGKARYRALQEVERKYSGRGVGLYAGSALLHADFDSLYLKGGTSGNYRALYNRCVDFERRRAALTGRERVLTADLKDVVSLMEMMNGQSLSVSADEKDIIIRFVNLKSAELQIGKMTPVKVVNDAGSFFATDTVRIPIPKIDDGEYTVTARSGKVEAQEKLSKYTISLAVRKEGRGHTIYAADYKSGYPVKDVDIVLYNNKDKVIARSSQSLNGFTLLPADFRALAEKGHCRLSVSYMDDGVLRKSPKVFLYMPEPHFDDVMDAGAVGLFLDRGAYNPGDTVKFKAVLYRPGSIGDAGKVLPSRDLTFYLYDTESHKIDSVSVKTDRMGSASGRLVIPKGIRGGLFEILGYGKHGETGLNRWIRVDEFLLPTFRISCDDAERIWMVGDKVHVGGMVESLSGHSMAGATAVVEAYYRYDEHVDSQKIRIKDDGVWGIDFVAESPGYYRIIVKVSGATGETSEETYSLYVGDYSSLSINLLNAAVGQFELKKNAFRDDVTYLKGMVRDDYAKVRLEFGSEGMSYSNVRLHYSFTDCEGEVIGSGDTVPMAELSLPVKTAGLYMLKVESVVTAVDGHEYRNTTVMDILRPGESVLDAPVTRFAIYSSDEVVSGDIFGIRFGATDGPVWAVVSLFDDKGSALDSYIVELAGVAGKPGSIYDASCVYKDEYSDTVHMEVFYFKDGESVIYRSDFHRRREPVIIPLSFTSFVEKAGPGEELTVSVKGIPGMEGAATVYDASLDYIYKCHWDAVQPDSDVVFVLETRTATGRVGIDELRFRLMSNGMVKAMDVDAAVEMVSLGGQEDNYNIRQVFSDALAFVPRIKADRDGVMTFKFKTSDKLSTYRVRFFAHDRNMRNGVLARDFMVTVPVKVDVRVPAFLYEGDKYEVAPTVSYSGDVDVDGDLSVYFYPESVKRDGNVVIVPEGLDTLGVKVVFVAQAGVKEFSDAMYVKVPVLRRAQTLKEAHSAVLRSGMSRDSLEADLRGRFVNAGAQSVREVSVRDMVQEVLEGNVKMEGKDVLSMAGDYYCSLVLGRGAAEGLIDRILACRNEDGGFAWFEGMKSSQAVTAVLLERFAKLRDAGFEVPDMAHSVKYLDEDRFGGEKPYWCGGLSEAQYLYVRALYPEVKFEAGKPEQLKEFRKRTATYLVPKKARGLEGEVWAKTRRLATLWRLSASDEGVALAARFGVKAGTLKKLRSSIAADVASLVEYAVPHQDGGWYFPNLVMPYRGLLETEAYAHSMICDLFTALGVGGDIPEGIRLWLMLQKETQKWDATPHFVDAVMTVLSGGEKTLATKVVVMESEFTLPFEEISPAGNGFSVERKFYKSVDGGLKELREGDEVRVGDKIVARYEVWSQENRSFVRICAPREASLRPVNQLSGHIGWWLRPFGGFSPQGYRDVRMDRTYYYFDAWPEEKTVLTEEFFVTQAGGFAAPALTVESLYAPHYRANTGCGVLESLK